MYSRADEGVRFAATEVFSLLRRNCSVSNGAGVQRERYIQLKKLGVKPWIAHETSYIKGYMKAVRLPQITKAISKEKLTKRGLVSPLDYYLNQHTLKLN